MSVRLSMKSLRRLLAPVRPVSSSTVNRNSRGVLERPVAMMARLVATATPLSAPRVVPLAVT